MSADKHGFAFVLYDGKSYFTFAEPIVGFENYQIPGRRDEASQDTIDISYGGIVEAATNDGTVAKTHEVFDLVDATRKPDVCKWHNISNNANKIVTQFYDQLGSEGVGECGDIPGNYLNSVGTLIKAENIGFAPFTPAFQEDGDTSSLDWRPNLYVNNNGPDYDDSPYNPKGFGPNYYAKGVAFRGLSSYPSWAVALSVVRTKAARNVVAQGLAFYALKSAQGSFGANMSKATNKIWLYCPDIDTETGFDASVIESMMNNVDGYKIQVQSALGFFSEVYSFMDQTLGANYGIDMISYARIIREEIVDGYSQINPEEHSDIGIGDDPDKRYVGFGDWRRSSDQTNGIFANAQNPTITNPISIVSINNVPEYRGRGQYLEVVLDTDIFWHEYAGSVYGGGGR